AVMRGTGEKPTFGYMLSRLWHAAYTWITTRPIWKTRGLSSLFHIMISLGFVFYFLVNFGDVIEGMFPVTFLGENIVGDFYRLLADIATMSVLVGVIYFILRRFVFNDKALTYHENIKLVDRVKQGGIRRDSFIVAFFILFHVGFRWIGNSFKVSLEGGDPWQPFSTALGQLWMGWPEGARTVGEHLGWWLAIGLILAFLPYFPYTKHFHLIMSG
ncbi:MAG: [Fe-S]-binding protein, partial [Caldilineaceae bacterium]|nr:[Fe-S]-binding protein [Caldilineaceae bacterium]